jgi:hypothetical protein
MTPAEAIEYANRLPPDEPCFILRGRDAFAPGAVQSWAVLCLSANPKLVKTRAKGERAMVLAEEMRDWQERHGAKIPD